MLKILAIVLTGGSALYGLANPWIGAVVGYWVVLFSPHTVWWWAYGGLRPFMYVAAPAFVGAVYLVASRKIPFDVFTTRTSRLVGVWWLCIIVSYYFGDFTHHPGPPRFFNAAGVLEAVNKSFAFYFLAALVIRDARSFKWLSCVMVVTIIYYIYWANNLFLFGPMHWYQEGGRLGGPFDMYGGGPYRDQNVFGMLYAFGLPFLYYFGWYFRQRLFRWGLWCLIPFGWHAVFLTSSRGALLGVAVSLVLIVLRSRRRYVGIFLLPIFALAYVDQAGHQMKSRVGAAEEYKQDRSATGRLDAWAAASKMIADNPITGVGVASFGPAFPVYSSDQPRAAHNTFFQLAAESGIIAGACWMMLVIGISWRLWRRPRYDFATIEDSDARFAACMSDALFAALGGYFACAMFLSLQTSEVFIFLLVIAQYLERTSAKEPVASKKTLTKLEHRELSP